MIEPGPQLGGGPAWSGQRDQVAGSGRKELLGLPGLEDGTLFGGQGPAHGGVGPFLLHREAIGGSFAELAPVGALQSQADVLVTPKPRAGRTKKPTRKNQTRYSTGMLRW